MHPRERVLEQLRLHKERDLAIPTDLAALAVRLGLFLSVFDVQHLTNPKQTEEVQGASKNGASIFQDP